ncbi:sigma 54-interacting transcriptional regulator [uncultured Victivallis sp.]|uniref:sigma-54-dependent transcriptional regulator n=1 Tax=uncultured Victivallis sp. TaxID=354118 RepID=UPI0025CE556B|nr:sigma 54-interacting transcriptional regulator [uncultured Victivallis sp.]
MKLFTEQEAPLLRALGKLNYTNPFTPERLELEEIILGRPPAPERRVWNMHDGARGTREDVTELAELAKHWANELRRRTELPGVKLDGTALDVAEPVVIYHLFEKHRAAMTAQMLNSPDETRFPCYDEFAADFDYFLNRPGRRLQCSYEPERTFAIYFQIHRAFHHIFDFLIGGTLAAGKLRAEVWQSLFTVDIYRYHRALYNRMQEINTLITGESGTGKELVARAIALSQYIPFDARSRRFRTAYPGCFRPVHLSALPQTMLESELFGHRKGAYTGALSDRVGYLEACDPSDAVLLDEIGEINAEVQVKLLRVLQTRRFQRLGDNAEREFSGKIIAATNRDLARACREGKFRNDLYYRLCSDTIETVPLRDLTGGSPAELEKFVDILAGRLLGEEESKRFLPEAMEWIIRHLGAEYPWPGNVRELEQCVRNLVIRGSYTPAPPAEPAENAERPELERLLSRCTLSADELLRTYVGLVRRRAGSCVKAAEQLKLDRRTVAKYLPPEP